MVILEQGNLTAGDFRALLGRHQIHKYAVAPRVGLWPNAFGALLREERAMTPEMSQRVERAINNILKERLEEINEG